MPVKNIILTSGSPRRKMLLEWAELDFRVMSAPTDEKFPPGLSVEEVPIHIARNKALAVAAVLPADTQNIFIAADTIVVLDGEIIGKPVDQQDAIRTLKKLSGRVHRVITGVVLLNGTKEVTFADSTEVEFYKLTSAQISFYVEKYKPFDKAGAYAIQEWIGVVGIKTIKGDFYNVMGLPVSRVVKELQQFG